MKVEMVRLDRPEAIETRIEGAPTGIVGRLSATSITTLSDDGDGTRIHYTIESVLTGRLGSLGQPVLKAKARDVERQFIERLRTAFTHAAPTESA
jgi:carbon monoxide dehydrogenase subunit G